MLFREHFLSPYQSITIRVIGMILVKKVCSISGTQSKKNANKKISHGTSKIFNIFLNIEPSTIQHWPLSNLPPPSSAPSTAAAIATLRSGVQKAAAAQVERPIVVNWWWH
jgi:hypothetical protein